MATVLFALTLAASEFGGDPSVQQGRRLFYGTGLVSLLAACVIVPVFEEVLFREALPRLLAAAMPVQLAVFFSAAAFAAVHLGFGWPAWTVLFLGGLMLSAIYDLSGNLLVPIIVHVLLNAALTAYDFLG